MPMDPATRSYALALDYLREQAQRDFLLLWRATARGANPVDLREAFNIIQQTYGVQAAAAATDYLIMQQSLDEHFAMDAMPMANAPVGREQAEASFRWAVSVIDDWTSWAELEVARRRLEGVLTRLVTLPASHTVAEAALDSGMAFARVPEPGACTFCLMLASRGGVYTRESVGAVTKYHDNCRCLGVRVRRDGSDLPRINRDLEKLWKSSSSVTMEDFAEALAKRRGAA